MAFSLSYNHITVCTKRIHLIYIFNNRVKQVIHAVEITNSKSIDHRINKIKINLTNALRQKKNNEEDNKKEFILVN